MNAERSRLLPGCVVLAILVAMALPASAGDDLRGDYRRLLAAHEKLVAAVEARDKAASPREFRLLLPDAADTDELELTLRARGDKWVHAYAESLAWCQGTMMEWRAFHLANHAGCMWRCNMQFAADTAALPAAKDKLPGELAVAFRIDKTLDQKLPPGEPVGWWDRFIPTGFSEPRKQTIRLDAAVADGAVLLEMVLEGGVNWTGKAKDGNAVVSHRPITVRLVLPGGASAARPVVRTPTWNGGFHEADADGLKFADGRVTGTMMVYLHQDGWMPFGGKAPQHEPVEVKFELNARLLNNTLSGDYSAGMGGTYTGRVYLGGGSTDVIPETKWTGKVHGRGGKAVLGRYTSQGGIGARTGPIIGMLLDAPAAARELIRAPAALPADDAAAARQTAQNINGVLHGIRAANLALQRDIDLVDALRQTAVAEPVLGAVSADVVAAYCARANQLVASGLVEDLPKVMQENEADSPSLGTHTAAVDNDVNTVAQPPVGGWLFLPRWKVLGPFEQKPGLDHDFATVSDVVPFAPLSWAQTEDRFGLPVADAKAMQWVDANCTSSRLSPPWERPGFYSRFVGQAWYAAARVKCDRGQPVTLALESGEHAKLWVNGRLIWTDSENTWRYRQRGRAFVTTKLNAGVNELLLRVHKDRHVSWVRVALKVGEYTASLERPAVAPAGSPPSQGGYSQSAYSFPDAKPPLAWDLDANANVNVAWRRADLAGASRPLALGDALYVAVAPQTLLCLDAAAGKTRWSADAADSAPKDARLETRAGQPVTDGLHIWFHGNGTAACFDLTGKRIWSQPTGLAYGEAHLHKGILAIEGKASPAWQGGDAAPKKGQRLPELTGVLLLDAAKGDVRQRFTIPGQFQRETARVIVCGSGADQAAALLTSTSHLVDLNAGKDLGSLDVNFPGPSDDSYHAGVQIIGSKPGRPFGVAVAGNMIFMAAQEQSVAVRFWPAGGGRLGYAQAWESNYEHGGFGSFQAPCAATGRHVFSWMPVLDRGPHCPDPRIELHVQDAATGRVRRVLKPALKGAVIHEVVPAVAGGYVFCTDSGGGTHGGSPFGQMLIVTADEHIRVVACNKVDLGTRLAPVFAGERMFLRSDKSLTCIAVAGGEGLLYQKRRLAAQLIDEIGPRLEIPTPVEIEPLAPAALAEGVPVGKLLDARTTENWVAVGPASTCPDDAALAALRPKAGDSVVCGSDKKTFAPVSRKFAYSEPPTYLRQSQLQGTGDIVPFFHTYVDPNCCAGPAGSGLLYAVLDNPCDRYVTPAFQGPGLAAWLGGRKLQLGGEPPQLLHLKPGLYPLLVRVSGDYFKPGAAVASEPATPGAQPQPRDLRLNPSFRFVPHPPTQIGNRLERIRRCADLLQTILKDLPQTAEAAAAAKMLEEIK